MILFLVLMFLAGAGLIAYGIWEQKNVYADQHFTTARVIGYQPCTSTNLMFLAANAAAGMQNPIVNVTLDSGEVRQLKVHTPVPYNMTGKDYPELRIGGEISVTYFGQNPKEAFLIDHPLEERPVKTSTFLMLGLVLAGAVIVTLLLWLLILNV